MATSTEREDAKIKLESFLTVADDVQRLALGKVLAVGLYPDRVILMNRPAGVTTPAQLEKLSLLLAIRGLPMGEHSAMLSITFPDGKVKANANPAQVTVPEPGDAINLQMAFAPFVVPTPGVFALEARIAGRTVRETFTILHRDLSQVLTELALRPQPPIPASQLDLQAQKSRAPKKAAVKQVAKPAIRPGAKKARRPPR